MEIDKLIFPFIDVSAEVIAGIAVMGATFGICYLLTDGVRAILRRLRAPRDLPQLSDPFHTRPLDETERAALHDWIKRLDNHQ